MRQISIKELKANLCKELQSLPFQITKYGKIIADVGGHNQTKGGYKLKTAKKQPTGIVKDKPKVLTSEATIPTGGGYFNPQPKGKK